MIPVAAVADRKRDDLDLLLKLLPHSSTRITGRINAVDKSWEDWQKRTGELPPDFDSIPSQPFLPDPLEGVKTRADWQKKRAWIRSQFEKWITGTMPPSPGNLRAVVLSETQEGGITIRDVRLEFGPDHSATLRVQLLIPPGKGPFPVFLTNHLRTRPWVNTAVRRGYIGCIYYALDPIYGTDDDSDKFIEIYPQYDFSCLSRWAWAAMRAVDYLYTVPQVDRSKIGLTGHSRNGKQALIAAAFDERITVVVTSSGNTGEVIPWRYTNDTFTGESLEQITGSFPHWFHPRLRFFVGREDKLPVDQNSLLAMVAPRGLMMASAFSESQGNAWAFEQAYRSVSEVYRFLGRPENIGLSLRPGEHPTTAEDIERYVDFFDGIFGRIKPRKIEQWMYGYTFDDWRRLSGEQAPAKLPSDKIRWALGDEPAGVRYPARTKMEEAARSSEGYLHLLQTRPLKLRGAKATEVSFGDDLKADLYFPEAASGKFPIVIWLHSHAYATGYSRYAAAPFAELIARGYAVLAFDQIGFGTRAEQALEFYRRYPHWSLLGKMVADTRAAIDAAAALERIDAKRIYLAGFGLGGKVAMWTAAMDRRPAAVVSIAGLTPLRSAPASTEGIRHYSHLHGLLPRLGFYVAKPAELPVDYDDVIAATGSRPVLVVAPEFDRFASLDDIRKLASSHKNVRLESPRDFARFSAQTRTLVFDWLDGLSSARK